MRACICNVFNAVLSRGVARGGQLLLSSAVLPGGDAVMT